MARSVAKLYQELKLIYGKPSGQWSLWCKRPKTITEREQVMIEAILTQRANWRNVVSAVAHLKRARVFSLKKITSLGSADLAVLARLIRPSGFYQQKARYLLGLANFILAQGGIEKIKKQPLKDLRPKILALKGVGPETADDILLYALDKPVFVIDEYTRRLVKQKGITMESDYYCLQKLFEANLKKDYRLYQDLHALIVINGKQSKK